MLKGSQTKEDHCQESTMKTDFFGKKMKPITKHFIRQSESKFKSNLIRRIKGRSVGFEWENPHKKWDLNQNVPKRVILDINSQKRAQSFFLGFVNMEKKEANLLAASLRKRTSLQSISLNMRMLEKADVELEPLMECLQSLTSLTKISLNFMACNEILGAELNYLYHVLKKFPKLRHLSLNFGNSRFSNIDLHNLNQGLCKLSTLRDLSLYFSWCNEITDKGLVYLSEGFQALTSLARLSLNIFECSNITDNGLKILKNLASLQHLSLCLSSQNLTDVGLQYLTQDFQTFTSLTRISLYFFECKKISCAGLDNLRQNIQKLACLQNLSLTFSSCSIKNMGIGYLRQGLLQLTSLKRISLAFHDCEIDDDGLGYLKQGLEKLTSLQEISLTFSSYKSPSRISNFGLNTLKKAFQVLPSLTSIVLDFPGSNITDAGKDDFRKSICETFPRISLRINEGMKLLRKYL